MFNQIWKCTVLKEKWVYQHGMSMKYTGFSVPAGVAGRIYTCFIWLMDRNLDL